MSAREFMGAADAARLGMAQVALQKACEGLGYGDGRLVWTVPERQVRAFLWAVYTGTDPVLAVARRMFGVQGYDQLGPGGIAAARAAAARLAGAGVAIPRRVGSRL